MLRRTFLKAVFAAAVAPASAVKALYRPGAGLTDDTIRDLIATTLNALPKDGLWSLYIKDNKICYRTLEEEWIKTLKDLKFKPPIRR